jgi:probable phosphoglycerate mutase
MAPLVVRRDRFGSIRTTLRALLPRHRRDKKRCAEMSFVGVAAEAVPPTATASSAAGVTAEAVPPTAAASSAAQDTEAELCPPVAVAQVSDWVPASAHCTLNAALGAPNAAVVVLDGLVSEQLRRELLVAICGSGGDEETAGPPAELWDRATVDNVGLPPSWGLRQSLLRRLESDPPACVVAVQSRLAALYPEYVVCHMPTLQEGEDGARAYMRTSFVANAAVHGDGFAWHVDADPQHMPSASWRAAFGEYTNGHAGKPLLVSLVVYLNARWQAEWDVRSRR